ncbi:MAG: hypothetical protein H7Y38_17345, partial [Armatimonadetes bacterium]|nr:hypothetical protein [Armatimonadota bacterium]
MTISRGFQKHLTLLSVLLLADINGAAAQTDLARDATARIAEAVKATGANAKAFDFYAHTPYREGVPRPDTVLGYPLGTWHSTFYQQEKVLAAIVAAAPDRVKMLEYGTSVEGRPLRVYAVSSPANIARLEQIRAANLTVANGGASPPPPDLPAIVWINHTIHGSETASFETAMATMYTLAASDAPTIRTALDSVVVIINPIFNPDGHERFVVTYNAAAIGDATDGAFESETPWIAAGRFNHNRFDMNRDKIAQSQPETRQETAEYLRWMPHVFVDQHGQPQTYFFPPNAQATNPNTDRERMNRWTQTFGRANGAAFDSRGWAYVTRETYDLFYPGYLDSFTSLMGAVGMTYETDGGGELVTKKRDGTLTTLRDAAARHHETALTTVVTAAKNRTTLVADFATFRADATKFAGGVLISPERDPTRMGELASLLVRVGVEVRRTTAPVTVDTALYDVPGDKRGAHTFPVGSLIVPYGQAQGHLARALLERDTALEPDFAARQRRKQKANAAKNS